MENTIENGIARRIEIAGTRTTSDGTRVAVVREYDGRLTTVTFSDIAQLISEMEEV